MEKNREHQAEKIARLEEAIRALPAELQQAIFWAIENLELLKEIGKRSEMTPEEIRDAKAGALSKEQYAALMLLHITEIMKQSKENEEL